MLWGEGVEVKLKFIIGKLVERNCIKEKIIKFLFK